MRQLIRLGLTALLVVTPVCSAYAAPDDDNDIDTLQTRLGRDWVLVKNDKMRNIKTYAKQEDGKHFRSFKVEATLDGTLEAGARVLLDFENYNKWYWEVLETKLLKRVSPTEYYIYFVHRAPYGLPNRDVILHATVDPPTKQKRSITLRVRAAPDYMDDKPPLIRMRAEDMTVSFTPLPDNKVQVEAEGYIDPGGTAPNWAVNYIQRNAPYSVILGMQRMVIKDEYAHSRVPLPFSIAPTE